MTVQEFKNRIKSGNLSGWYIFTGEEDYLKKYYLTSLRDAVVGEDAFALFNHVTFDGQDVDFAAISEAIKAPPMMGEYKLIEWKFANIEALKEGEKTALCSLFELKEEHPYSVFAIMTTSSGLDVGTPKKPSKLATRLSAGFDIINFEKSTDSQLLSWLKKHFDAEGVSVTLDTLNALLFRAGHSMDVLNNEVKKLCAYAMANGMERITPAVVEEVSSATVECDAFALSNAVIDKNVNKAFTALTDLKMRRVEPTVIIAMLEKVYSDLSSVAFLLDEGRDAKDIEAILKFHSYKAKLYIGAAKKLGKNSLADSLDSLRRLDAASKSGGLSGYGAIEIFVSQNL